MSWKMKQNNGEEGDWLRRSGPRITTRLKEAKGMEMNWRLTTRPKEAKGMEMNQR